MIGHVIARSRTQPTCRSCPYLVVNGQLRQLNRSYSFKSGMIRKRLMIQSARHSRPCHCMFGTLQHFSSGCNSPHLVMTRQLRRCFEHLYKFKICFDDPGMSHAQQQQIFAKTAQHFLNAKTSHLVKNWKMTRSSYSSDSNLQHCQKGMKLDMNGQARHLNWSYCSKTEVIAIVHILFWMDSCNTRLVLLFKE